MKKIWILMLLLNACLLANVVAKEDGGAAKDIGNSLKKAGDAAGSVMEQGGKAAAPEVHKAETWLDGVLHKGGKKSDKADK